jgi:hypothetical protein
MLPYSIVLSCPLLNHSYLLYKQTADNVPLDACTCDVEFHTLGPVDKGSDGMDVRPHHQADCRDCALK